MSDVTLIGELRRREIADKHRATRAEYPQASETEVAETVGSEYGLSAEDVLAIARMHPASE